jgi:hypothetical protein
MPLTLRPTGLSRDPNAKDWSIHEDGAEIGRLYEGSAPGGAAVASRSPGGLGYGQLRPPLRSD